MLSLSLIVIYSVLSTQVFQEAVMQSLEERVITLEKLVKSLSEKINEQQQINKDTSCLLNSISKALVGSEQEKEFYKQLLVKKRNYLLKLNIYLIY